ncbi:hypothetical protein KIH74_19010 [Kineosporia sp. J2-2]|uniref:SAF domain-containing protein n=1 Tax=Kineosporia corallincola TaxID=2835133 RepID=A0ABS5TIV8_9ACTN|nr:SAF domain-containing protein [Kineosporia corallincola]MBT0771037.1 hypothetical protein [Kineosporia corallincola]
MGRRTLLLVLSVLLAAIGTAMVALYVREAGQRAARAEATAGYVVAARAIAAGTTIGAGDLTTRVMRVRDQLPTSVTDPAAVIGRAATAGILTGATIDSRQLTRPGARAEAAIRSGELGVDVLLQDPNRAVSLLGVGSTVRVFRTDPQGDVDVLVEQARVISVGGALDDSGTPGPDGANGVAAATVPQAVVGLSVRERVARLLITALGRREPLYFAVVPAGDVTEAGR